jgi:hypothetical protein
MGRKSTKKIKKLCKYCLYLTVFLKWSCHINTEPIKTANNPSFDPV